MKKLYFILLLISTNIQAEQFVPDNLPDELKDCVFLEVRKEAMLGHTTLNVVRCPNSTTSVTSTQGKTPVTVITIDGIEYVKKK
jgi:hypothetical protein